MSDDGNDDSSCDVVSVKCIVAPVGLASHGGVISFSGVNIASSDCVFATQHERCLSPLNPLIPDSFSKIMKNLKLLPNRQKWCLRPQK